MLTVLLYFRSGGLRINLEAVRRAYDKYRCLADTPDEIEAKKSAECVNFNALFEENLL